MPCHLKRTVTQPPQHRSLPRRMGAWYRDAAASAFAISRWEDDGGLVDGSRFELNRPLRTDGRMPPHRSRDI